MKIADIEPDMKFTIRGSLKFLHWSCVVFLVLSIPYFFLNAIAGGPVSLFLYVLLYVLLFVLNKIFYELALGILEIIKHLREIRHALININLNIKKDKEEK